MNLPFLSLAAFLFTMTFAGAAAVSQAVEPVAPVAVVVPALRASPLQPFSRFAMALRAGSGGVGFDLAVPVDRKINLRAGSEFFGYSTSFQDQGATIALNLRMRSGHASLDWYPFGGGFRLSPLLVFANNNHAQATALIPAGSTVTLSGKDYNSSVTDPLHGAGSVDFRKTAPGLTLGWGNGVPRGHGHFSFPVEAGFYYVGQPRLRVAFSGSACDPALPAAVGCESVNQDPGFQQSLAQFIARNNNNLSYVSFFPVLSVGFGYAF